MLGANNARINAFEAENRKLRADLLALHGATVCCCCAPAPCHGDVLLAAAAWVASQAGVTPD